jgi:hypothetical protein
MFRLVPRHIPSIRQRLWHLGVDTMDVQDRLVARDIWTYRTAIVAVSEGYSVRLMPGNPKTNCKIVALTVYLEGSSGKWRTR